MMFSASFSSAFAGVGKKYIAPMMAQAALGDGAAWAFVGGVLMIEGAELIGPAGKTYAFASEASAAKWVEHTRAAGIRQHTVVAAMSPEKAADWIERKREKLETLAGRLIGSAAKVADPAKRAALIAESDYCLTKWL